MTTGIVRFILSALLKSIRGELGIIKTILGYISSHIACLIISLCMKSAKGKISRLFNNKNNPKSKVVYDGEKSLYSFLASARYSNKDDIVKRPILP
jgi:hypothetical protein